MSSTSSSGPRGLGGPQLPPLRLELPPVSRIRARATACQGQALGLGSLRSKDSGRGWWRSEGDWWRSAGDSWGSGRGWWESRTSPGAGMRIPLLLQVPAGHVENAQRSPAEAEAVGRGLTRRAGFRPFPVDPEGERSEFRGAESSRKSITLSMAEHGSQCVGRRARIGQRIPARCQSIKLDTQPSDAELRLPGSLPPWGKADKDLPCQSLVPL